MEGVRRGVCVRLCFAELRSQDWLSSLETY